MANPVTLYQSEMHDNFGFFATWLPGDTIEVGDVGTIERGQFRKVTSLEELNIKFEVASAQSTQDVNITSSSGVAVKSSVSAQHSGLGEAGVTVDFSKEGAFLFSGSNLVQHTISYRMATTESLIRSFKDGKWKSEWLLVDRLYTCDRAVVLVSEGSNAQVVLSLDNQNLAKSPSVVDPKLDFSVASISGKVVQVLGKSGLSPLYSCLRVNVSLLGDVKVKPVRGGALLGDLKEFTRLSIEELLNS